MNTHARLWFIAVVIALLALSACRGGGGSPPPATAGSSDWDRMVWDQDVWG